MNQPKDPNKVDPWDTQSTTLTDAIPEGADHRTLKPNGQQIAYKVLSPEELAKGFVRPLRHSYVHNVPGCREVTTMSQKISETYARDPHFYSGTFCVACGSHFPLDQFVWSDDGTPVGS